MAPAFINTKAKLLTFSGSTYSIDFLKIILFCCIITILTIVALKSLFLQKVQLQGNLG